MFLGTLRRGRHLALAEREAKRVKQCLAGQVIVGRRNNRDIHAAGNINTVVVDFEEHQLFGKTERVVAVAIPLATGQATEVADTRNRHRKQAIKELPHAVTTQGDLGADCLIFAQFERGNGDA